ncbi:MAG TPA: serine/threonine-protein kinase [Polyangia bacterium]|nr:serine/threonine-protein kinase [Polyangia bacterium]
MNEFPRRFGNYVLLKPLARGGMGALYLALSGPDETAKLCVIKTVLPHLADKEYLQRFRDEAKVVVRLSHGNLVPVFDSGQVAGEIYLAMDYIDGKDLRATWNRCAKKGIAFPIDVAVHLTRELARGLHYAHTFSDIKLVHRDVSPPNVLLSYTGEVRLTDFGLAASTLKLEKTAPGIIYGKVSYMSPEQARGETLDGRTDLYAAGIILWELLTGRQLFPSGKAPGAGKDMITAEELLRRVRDPEVVAPSKRATRVPPELDRITLKALAPKLADRYANCEELRHDLATFLAQTAPAMDSMRVASFLKELYAPDIESERAEREALIKTAREWFSSGALPRAALAAAAPSVAGGPRKTMVPPAPTVAPKSLFAPKPPADAGGGDKVARAERGTLIAGPNRHDKALDKRNTQAMSGDAKTTDEMVSGERPSQTGLSAAVVGTVVGGRYFVRRLCGEGGMGRVYEAEHTDIGKRVALKILHPAYSQTPDLVERLRREARAASKISHPNVVDVTDSGTTPDGAFFFVMEYIEGIELGELIFKEGKLGLARALNIGGQICRALQAAHAVNVIHRDLKPENVLILSRDGQRDFVKVLDFGIAKSGTDDEKPTDGKTPRRLTHPGMTMGTPEYMAPEQAAGRPADPRSDVYAAGGLMYEMLSGKPPYEGNNFMEILHKKATTLPAPLSTLRDDIPPTLDALIMRTLAKDPAARPQSMEELGRLLLDVGGMAYPSIGKIDLAFFDAADSAGTSSRQVAPPASSAHSTSALLTRLRSLERQKVVVAAGGLVGLVIAFIVVGAMSGKHAAKPAPVVVAAPVVAPPPVVAAAPVVAPPPVAPPEAAADDEGESAAEKEAAARRGAKPRGSVAPTAAESKKLLTEGQRLMRAERFPEARNIFEKLSQSKRDRGPALVALAEISFQEKNYTQAVKSAQLAAERGGGVRARVLQGDANFRLNHFKEAAAAYQAALKLDPGNASAKSGLQLANKRM